MAKIVVIHIADIWTCHFKIKISVILKWYKNLLWKYVNVLNEDTVLFIDWLNYWLQNEDNHFQTIHGPNTSSGF